MKAIKEILESVFSKVKDLPPASQKAALEAIPGLSSAIKALAESYAKAKTPPSQIPKILMWAINILGLGYLIAGGGIEQAGKGIGAGLSALTQPVLILGGALLVGAIIYKQYGK